MSGHPTRIIPAVIEKYGRVMIADLFVEVTEDTTHIHFVTRPRLLSKSGAHAFLAAYPGNFRETIPHLLGL